MKYAAKKIVWMLLTMVIVSFLAFLAFRIIPAWLLLSCFFSHHLFYPTACSFYIPA